MASDAVMIVNCIILAANETEKERAAKDPEYMDIRAKACILVQACLEGRVSVEQPPGALGSSLSKITNNRPTSSATECWRASSR